MSFTFDATGKELTETIDDVTLPVGLSFKKINGWIHGPDVQFEEIQAVCLGLARENDRLKQLLSDIKKWDIDQYLTLPRVLRQRIQTELEGR